MLDILIESYTEKGIEPEDLNKARQQLEKTINIEKDPNQSIKEGEENDEH